MKPHVRTLGSILDTYLGRCPKCARTSFVFMVAAGSLALTATIMTNSPSLLIASWLLAVGSAGLWFSHLGAFALRTARSKSISKVTALHYADDSGLRSEEHTSELQSLRHL